MVAGHKLQGQPIERPWEIGIGAGMNWQKVKVESSNSHFDGWWLFSPSSTSTSTKIWGKRRGYSGSALVNFHPRKHFSLQSGLVVSSVESHASRTRISTYFYDESEDVTHVDIVQFDKEYVLMDVPLLFRWYLNPGENNDNPLKIFIDIGTVFRFPLANNSTLQKWEDGVLVNSGKLDMKNNSGYFGIGARVEQYAIAVNWTQLHHDDSDYRSNLFAVNLTRYFSVGKK